MRSESGIYMLQKQYVTTMLKKYGMLGCKPIYVPLDENYKLRVDFTLIYKRDFKQRICHVNTPFPYILDLLK